MSVRNLKTSRWLAGAAMLIAGAVPVKAASADEAAAPANPELSNAVEYFVTRPTRVSRDPSRGHLAFEDFSVSVGTAFSYFGQGDIGVHDVINETYATVAKGFNAFGARWAAELDVTRAGDVDDQFETLNWSYQGSLNRNFTVAERTLQASFWVRYDDGNTLGNGNNAFWSPGVTLSMPMEIGDHCLANRAPRTRGLLTDNLADKLLPSVSINEVFNRPIAGSAGRDWEAEAALGYEHPIARDLTCGVTARWNYHHIIEDASYSLRPSVTTRLNEMVTLEAYINFERGLVEHDQHAEIYGVAVTFDF